MIHTTDTSFETNTQAPDFQMQIDTITNRSLTPENIDSYADGALDKLIEVVQEVVTDYGHNPTINGKDTQATERQAFAYYGLDVNTIESTLDHIVNIAEDIIRIREMTEQLGMGTVVITPPSNLETKIAAGKVSFEQKKQVPRLQTVLLILEKHFGININPKTTDDGDFRIIPGKVTSRMVRQVPYNLLDIPVLNRVIDICDEEGNRTFIFNRQKLQALGIDLESIVHMDKFEFDNLIERHPGVGKGLIYNDEKFVTQIVQLMEQLDGPEGGQAVDADKLLDPNNELSNGFRNVSNEDLIKLADELSPSELLTQRTITELSGMRKFPSASTINKRFGSLREFNQARGLDVANPWELSDEDLIDLANELSPGIPLDTTTIKILSKDKRFVSVGSIRTRFGTLKDFNQARGLEISRDFRALSNEELVELANELKPDESITAVMLADLSARGEFVSITVIKDRFGGLSKFNQARGLELDTLSDLSNEELIALADELSPSRTLTVSIIEEFSKQGKFVSVPTICKRFGGIRDFNKARGIEVNTLADLSDEELVCLADKLSPGLYLSRTAISKLSKDGSFVSTTSVTSRFGGVQQFNRLRGFERENLSDLSDEELIRLANELSPGEWLTLDAIDKLSQRRKFLSPSTITKRFGGAGAFNKARGLESRRLEN